MDATLTQYWPVLLKNPGGEEITVVVAYPRKPSDEIAAGLVRMQLGMPIKPPPEFRFQEEACLRALEAAGYRMLGIGPRQQ
ncbi:hypothetical protein ACLD0W_12505 [Alloalcanivorax sp. C16-1]|uniref:hypothetical protein n=1 Tax=Alloalcanivorax sp. C16-1 TaxID=3390051 RepID=UPI003970C0AA